MMKRKTTAPAPEQATAIGLNGEQAQALLGSISDVCKFLRQLPWAGRNIREWIKREYQLFNIHDLPPGKLPELLARLDVMRRRAIGHCVAMESMERSFLHFELGDPRADQNDLIALADEVAR